ncbi:MAG: tRNA epoxyqueuosine(34) reductase QueG [Phycisphaerales bacterium]
MSAAADLAVSRRVLSHARELGFALAGICDVRPSEHRKHIERWLAAGKHGEMSYLAEDLDTRLDPARLVPGAQSIILVADQYAPRGHADPPADPAHPAGRIARYARGRNYHQVIQRRTHELRDRLTGEHPGFKFRAFVDMSLVLEREHAARAGIGWTGKHTLVIHPRVGSWFLLGGVISTLRLPIPPEQEAVDDHCGTCTRCIDACPTDAITPYSVDASRCISYLTIEQRAPILPELHAPMGDWLFGCDICQEVCPHNSPRAALPDAPINPAYAPRRTAIHLLDLLGWTPADRAGAMHDSAMRRARLDMLKRNALILAGNALAKHELPGLLARVQALVADEAEPELVRTTAAQVLDRLANATKKPRA